MHATVVPVLPFVPRSVGRPSVRSFSYTPSFVPDREESGQGTPRRPPRGQQTSRGRHSSSHFYSGWHWAILGVTHKVDKATTSGFLRSDAFSRLPSLPPALLERQTSVLSNFQALSSCEANHRMPVPRQNKGYGSKQLFIRSSAPRANEADFHTQSNFK